MAARAGLLRFDLNATPADRRRVVAVLVAAIGGISISAILVRGMSAEPAAIAAWRCLGAALLLAPTLRGIERITPGDLARIGLAGLCLGAHFVTWFASLELTTVMRSTLLVCITPIWTGVAEAAGWGDAPGRRFWVGVALAIVGVVGLSAGEAGGDASLVGDGLALIGGMLAAAYMLIGRQVRQRVGVSPYMSLVCAAAALATWPYAVGTGVEMVGFEPQTWGLLVLAVLIPQLVGHQGLSYAVRYVPASTVSTLVLLEPVGATMLAGLILGEWPPVLALVPATVVLAGVVVAAKG